MFLKNITLLSIFIILISCSKPNDSSKDHLGKISFYNSINSKSFSFRISEKFTNSDNSAIDKKHSIMTKSEVKLLKGLLKKNNYCINKKDELLFEIVSKQEKIYDVTFSGLIEQQYNARSLTPAIYFGKCL